MHDELMQIIYVVICHHANKNNIKLVLCAWVIKFCEICRGWEIHSGVCAKNYQHRTWFDI